MRTADGLHSNVRELVFGEESRFVLWSWMPQSTLKELMIEQPTKVANMVQFREYE